MSTIYLSGVAVYQGNHCLLSALDLAIEPGQALTILGESGSGKSLLAHAIMGTLPPELQARGQLHCGTRQYDLANAANLRRLWGRELAILPQEPVMALDPTMRLLPQVAEGRWQEPAGAWQYARQALATLGLSRAAQHYPHQISGGMAQRAAYAAATIGGARLLIADEPSKGLDEEACDTLIWQLRKHLANEQCLLTITHDIRVARALGGRILVMRAGMVVEQGEAMQLLRQPQHDYSRQLLAAEPQAWPAEEYPPAGEWLLRGDGVGKSYAGRPLFAPQDIVLHQAERVALLAPSGIGKTTLGNMLIGLLPPDQGRVLRSASVSASGLQKLYQDPVQAFAPRITLRTAFADLLQRHRLPRAPLADLMARLQLDECLLDRLPSQVSGGELQRLALIRVLLLRPQLLFADEPTSRLDPLSQQQTMRCLLDELARIGCALLLVTHDKALAEKACSRSHQLQAAS